MRTAHVEGVVVTATAQFRRHQLTSAVVLAGVVVAGAVVYQMMKIYGPAFGASFLALAVVGAIVVIRPAFGLGAIIALALVGDARAWPWWPAVKNFSSREASLYINDQLTVNPFEILLALVLLMWFLGRARSLDARPVEWGPLWRPMLVFSVMLMFGLVWGLARGGDTRIAIFEIRPLIYIPLVYFAATNLFTSLRHYRLLLGGILAALTVESVRGYLTLDQIRAGFGDEQSPVEHTAALHMNLVFLALIAVLWFGTERFGVRTGLTLIAVPTMALYLVAERRAAVVGLIIGGAFLAAILHSRNRAKFMRVIPIIALLAAGYSAAFWNNDSSIGFPAQAVKTIVQPASASEADISSDLYRDIENYNLNVTIRSNPILGIGFGQQFLRPVPLPDISMFEFNEYIPHNSLLWIWTQIGIVGFLGFLYLVGYSTALGIRAARRAVARDDASLIGVFAAYVPMMFVVAFVDITFDVQTTVLFGTALALIGSAERLMGLDPFETEPVFVTDDRPRRAPLLTSAEQ